MADAEEQPAQATAPPAPVICAATLGGSGRVIRGQPVTQAEAEARRRSGSDVVVCGDELAANRRLAGEIEVNANGSYKRCPPHWSAGVHALPHCQPDPRPPDGHTFYETPNRKAA